MSLAVSHTALPSPLADPMVQSDKDRSFGFATLLDAVGPKPYAAEDQTTRNETDDPEFSETARPPDPDDNQYETRPVSAKTDPPDPETTTNLPQNEPSEGTTPRASADNTDSASGTETEVKPGQSGDGENIEKSVADSSSTSSVSPGGSETQASTSSAAIAQSPITATTSAPTPVDQPSSGQSPIIETVAATGTTTGIDQSARNAATTTNPSAITPTNPNQTSAGQNVPAEMGATTPTSASLPSPNLQGPVASSAGITGSTGTGPETSSLAEAGVKAASSASGPTDASKNTAPQSPSISGQTAAGQTAAGQTTPGQSAPSQANRSVLSPAPQIFPASVSSSLEMALQAKGVAANDLPEISMTADKSSIAPKPLVNVTTPGMTAIQGSNTGTGQSANSGSNNGAANNGASTSTPSAADILLGAQVSAESEFAAATQTASGSSISTGMSGVTSGSATPEGIPLVGGTGLTNGTTQTAAQLAAARPSSAPPPVSEQVGIQIARFAQPGTTRFNIQLQPAELGRVDVRLELGQDGKISALVTADRQDTLDLLQRDARGLERALQNSGLKADSNSLSFSLRDQGDSSGTFASNTSDPTVPDYANSEDQPLPSDVADLAALSSLGSGGDGHLNILV